MLLEERVEGIDDRWLVQPLVEPRRIPGVPSRWYLQHVGALVAEHELQFAELRRLEPGGLVEPVAEARERHRRERLDDVHLLDHHLHDRAGALERADRGVELAGEEVGLDLLQFVQEQLEPEFVGLVDDDEEHLVVLRRLGPRLLQREQLIEMQIIAVGEVHDCPPRR